jgi:hypothetical protein
MVFHKKEEIVTKTMAIVALATLIFMALSFMIVPNEGAESSFVLKLKADEPRIQFVNTAAGEFTEFNMELKSTSVDAFNHEIGLEVTDITYSGGSAATSWDIMFTDADSMNGDTGMYQVGPDETKDVALKVIFNGAAAGEMVTFTIMGTEDGENDTRLSPLGGSSAQFDYISVVSNAQYNPYLEPTSADDREMNDFPIDFSVTMWNLGSESDTLFISGVNVYLDNGDEIFSPAAGRAGEDVLNTNFEVTMETSTGTPYILNQEVFLISGDKEEIKGSVTPVQDNTDVPIGDYFVQVIVDSQNGEPAETLLRGHMAPVELPDFTVLKIDPNKVEFTEGDTVTIDVTIGIDSVAAGEVEYAVYIDDKLIDNTARKVSFTANDNNKVATVEWETETGPDSERTIKVVVDPDNDIRESNEDNNEKTARIEVADEDSQFPWWILLLAVGGAIVAAGAYWGYAGAPAGNVKIDDIIIRPDPPIAGKSAEIVAKIRNDGSDFEPGDKHSIVVSFYEDYESIGERPIDLTTDSFEGGSSREISLSWEPAAAGLHNLNVAVDIDDEESDVSSKDIEIGE